MTMHRTSYLPIHLPHSSFAIRDRNAAQSRWVVEKWVHALPVFVLLCFFILWWFSYPVELEIEDGRIAAVHPIEEMLESLNDRHVELAVLLASASAATPVAPTPQNFNLN